MEIPADRRDNASERVNEILNLYKNKETQFLLETLLDQVGNFFSKCPVFYQDPLPAIHSVKKRLKEPSHLVDKIERKRLEGTIVTPDNLFNTITDLAGVRVLHIYQNQFSLIHHQISQKIQTDREWVLVEPPKAYTWDPESKEYFDRLGIKTELKDSRYTSVHYVIKLNNQNPMCCEIQVRTLFEEIWGEIDHSINYPHRTNSIACVEQIRVLSKLVSTGTRLSDAIFKSYEDHLSRLK